MDNSEQAPQDGEKNIENTAASRLRRLIEAGQQDEIRADPAC